jgi:hypothetical protein
MSAPVFEVVLDHRDPAHHDRMERITRDLVVWAKQHGVTQVIREERTLRPGVVKLTFYPDPGTPPRRMSGDRLNLSKP